MHTQNMHAEVTDHVYASTEKPVAMVLQPSWNAFQGAATGESASENPFVQPPVIGAAGADASKVRYACPEPFVQNFTTSHGSLFMYC